jgi:hypothetical protein
VLLLLLLLGVLLVLLASVPLVVHRDAFASEQRHR